MKIPLPNTNLSLEYLMQMQKSIDRYCLFCTKKENYFVRFDKKSQKRARFRKSIAENVIFE